MIQTITRFNSVLIALAALLFFAFANFVSAEVNTVTPSTNDINRTNGWAHVDQLSAGVGETELQFISTRGFASCFEYRTDGDTSQMTSPTNYNTDITDGLYPFYCQNNNTRTETISADEYVEVRMVFGAESDERFDWTRFDVEEAPFEADLEITSPTAGETVGGTVSFMGIYTDEDGDDDVQWAIRQGTCAAGTNTVAGNVDGNSDDFDWDGENFSASIDMSGNDDGAYCFVLNPTEDSGDANLRATVEFTLENPDTEAPVVTIESPVDNAVVSGVVDVVGTVLDENLSHYNVSLYPEGADVNDFSLRLDGETTYGPEVTGATLWSFDSTDYLDGVYQIRLAARDLAGNRDLSTPEVGGDDSVHVIEITIDNVPDLVGPPTDKNDCKKGGWQEFNNPEFKNQGQCISYVQANEHAKK